MKRQAFRLLAERGLSKLLCFGQGKPALTGGQMARPYGHHSCQKQEAIHTSIISSTPPYVLARSP